MEQQRLILATANAHKAHEMRQLLEGRGWQVETAPPHAANVEETGDTFSANARLKALAVARATGEVALGDDSGLAVDALNGEPGLHSKRWAGPDATDAHRIAKLVRALESVPDPERTARFVCAVCIAAPDGVLWEGQGIAEGRILRAPRGDNGFGYDPVFLCPEQGRAMAEMSDREKNAVSHRGRALAAAAAWLQQHAGAGRSGP